jgi:hypothetical protein
MVGVASREGVPGTLDGWANKFGACASAGEGHQFGFCSISLEAIFVEPDEDCFIFGLRGFGGSFEGGGDGVYGSVVDVEGQVSMLPRLRDV